MEHIFGFVERNGVTVENLKTVGDAHTNLTGFNEVVREYPDCTITDRFRVMEKYRSSEDEAGNCYDWYVISEHYRYKDKFTDEVSQSVEQHGASIEELENAVCELDAMLNGGGENE